jgi:hypothetical protein
MSTPTNTPARHTPTPYDGEYHTTAHDCWSDADQKVIQLEADSRFIACFRDDAEGRANLAFVRTACNSHAQLTADVKRLRDSLAATEARADLVASSMHFSDPLALREELRLLAIGIRAALAATEGRS